MASLGNIVITGTSTGIGKATALHLDRLGYRVFASVRNESDAEALRTRGIRTAHALLFGRDRFQIDHQG